METEIKDAANEKFEKLCELAELTEAQKKFCEKISVRIGEGGFVHVSVEYVACGYEEEEK